MRFAIGGIPEPTPEILAFAGQIGASGLVLNKPDPAGRSILDAARPGNGPGREPWPDDLSAGTFSTCCRCAAVEESGLRVEAIESTPFWYYDKIMLGLPGADAQIENYKACIRAMGKAGIRILGYHWMANRVWRTTKTAHAWPRGNERLRPVAGGACDGELRTQLFQGRHLGNLHRLDPRGPAGCRGSRRDAGPSSRRPARCRNSVAWRGFSATSPASTGRWRSATALITASISASERGPSTVRGPCWRPFATSAARGGSSTATYATSLACCRNSTRPSSMMATLICWGFCGNSAKANFSGCLIEDHVPNIVWRHGLGDTGAARSPLAISAVYCGRSPSRQEFNSGFHDVLEAATANGASIVQAPRLCDVTSTKVRRPDRRAPAELGPGTAVARALFKQYSGDVRITVDGDHLRYPNRPVLGDRPEGGADKRLPARSTEKAGDRAAREPIRGCPNALRRRPPGVQRDVVLRPAKGCHGQPFG